MTMAKGFAVRKGMKTSGGRLSGADGRGAPTPSRTVKPAGIHAGETAEPAPLRLVENEAATRNVTPSEPEARAPGETTRQSSQASGGAFDGSQNPDRQMANELVRLVQELNRAMDEAKRNGLIVEPSLSTTKSPFGGEDSTGHMLSVKVFRKLC